MNERTVKHQHTQHGARNACALSVHTTSALRITRFVAHAQAVELEARLS